MTSKNMQDWILPPPVVKKKEYINADMSNRDTSAELQLDEHGKLFQNLLFYQNPVEDLKQIYNNWVTVNIERRCRSQAIDFGNGQRVEVVRVLLTKPTITLSDKGNVPLYPIECRNGGNTYGSSIYMDLSLMDGDQCIESANKVELGKIPVMTGSVLCHLYGMTDEELLNVGECPKDPRGIFIIKGTEKVIITQEKLRYNRISVTLSGKESKKQVPVCKITNYSIKGTSVIVLNSSNTGGIRIGFKFLNKDNTLSIFQVFRLYGIDDMVKMEEYVLLFVKKYKNKVSLNLVSSFNELINIGDDDIDDIEQKKGRLSEEEMSVPEKKKMIIEMIDNEIFPHMIDDTTESKIFLLSMMIARFCEYRIGVRKLDDRDDWGNKQATTAGRSLEYLFNQVVKYIFDNIQLGVRELISKGESINLSYVKKMFGLKKKDVTDTFYDSFGVAQWGLKAPQHNKQEGMTDIFKRESVLGSYYQLTKINANVNRQNKQAALRIVQPSQVGFVDIVDTPDGDQCGLLKYKAVTAFTSIDRDENLIMFYLKKYIIDGNDEGTNPCILNGKFFGFCHGRAVREELIKLKRTRKIYRDTCIVFDDTDDILYVYCDGGRLTRPLLVVNNTTGKLVYDELKEQYGKEFVNSFPNLERMGAVEYVDSWEQGFLNIAESTKEFEAYKYLYEQAQKHREDDYFSKLLYESDNELVTYYGKRFIYDNDIARDFVSFRQRFGYCELSPTAIFGTTSSLAPLPERTQGPRLQLQSVHEDETIMVSSGEFKKIKHLKNGDEVLTFDPVTFNTFQTRIKGHYVIDARKNGKIVHEISTISHRKIVCTNDHPFLVCEMDTKRKIEKPEREEEVYSDICIDLKYVRADQLTDNHYLAFLYTPVIYPQSGKDRLFEQVTEKELSEDIVLANQIKLLGSLFDIEKNDKRMPILCRILGAVQTDGTIVRDMPQGSYSFETEQDGIEFLEDIKLLGIETKVQVTHKEGFMYGSKCSHYTVEVSKRLCILLNSLGAVAGEKVTQKSSIVPSFIMNGCDLFKAEYLGGIMGGDGGRISYIHKNTTNNGFSIGVIQQSCLEEFIPSFQQWLGQIKTLFEDLGIEVSEVKTAPEKNPRTEKAQRFEVHILIKEKYKNFIKFMERVGYRYNYNKLNASLQCYEYFKYRKLEIQEIKRLRLLMVEMYDESFRRFNKTDPERLTFQRLSEHPLFREKFNTYQKVKYQFKKHNKGKSVKKLGWEGSLTPDEFFERCFVAKGITFVQFNKRIDVDNCMVSDFETEAGTHNFITKSGFISHNCNQIRQSVSIYNSNYSFRFDTPSKVLLAPSRPITETQAARYIGINDLPLGETVMLAFAVYTGYNQEDAIIFKKSAIERGLFKMVVFRSWKSTATPSADFIEEFVNPKNKEHKYRHLDEFGFVKEGSRVGKGDVLICKRRTYPTQVEGQQPFTYQNETIGIEEEGIVETVLKTTNPEGHQMVRVKVRQIKSPSVGDKFASRSAQKSTIGLILDDVYMPFDENGISPDIIINPHALPTRMTINKLYEMVASSYGALTAQRIDTTGFKNFSLKEAEKYLEEHQIKKTLERKMYSGFSGEMMEAEIFMGPCYYLALRHHVKDKIQMRARGAIKAQTHQPVDGRKNNGGLRFGEMEKDAIISHGASKLQRERLFYASDNWAVVVCRTCNHKAITHREGTRQFHTCRKCDTKAKFGICRFPFALNAMSDLLVGLGIDMTFTTEVIGQSTEVPEIENKELVLEEGGGDEEVNNDYE